MTINRRFIGEARLVSCAVEGLSAPLEVRLPPGEGPTPGARLRLRIEAAGALVFPAP